MLGTFRIARTSPSASDLGRILFGLRSVRGLSAPARVAPQRTDTDEERAEDPADDHRLAALRNPDSRIRRVACPSTLTESSTWFTLES